MDRNLPETGTPRKGIGKTSAMNLTENQPAKIQRNATIIQERLSGATYDEIAANHGIDKSTVSRVLSRDDIQDILQTGLQKQIALIPKAIDVLQKELADPFDGKARRWAVDTILKNTGLAPSGAPVTMIQNILNVQAETPKIIQDLFDAVQMRDCLPAIGGDEAIDV